MGEVITYKISKDGQKVEFDAEEGFQCSKNMSFAERITRAIGDVQNRREKPEIAGHGSVKIGV